MKNSRVKIVIFITLILVVMLTIMYQVYINTVPRIDNSYQQYIATQKTTNPEDLTQGWIGAQLTDLTNAIKECLNYPDPFGVYVQDTLRSSPAQTAGILPGDIISKVNNLDAQDVMPTLKLIADLTPGKNYPFLIFREGKFSEYQIMISKKQ